MPTSPALASPSPRPPSGPPGPSWWQPEPAGLEAPEGMPQLQAPPLLVCVIISNLSEPEASRHPPTANMASSACDEHSGVSTSRVLLNNE